MTLSHECWDKNHVTPCLTKLFLLNLKLKTQNTNQNPFLFSLTQICINICRYENNNQVIIIPKMIYFSFIQLQIYKFRWMESDPNKNSPLIPLLTGITSCNHSFSTFEYPWSQDLASFNFLVMLCSLNLKFCNFPFGVFFMLDQNYQAKFYAGIFETSFVNAINVNLFTLITRGLFRQGE